MQTAKAVLLSSGDHQYTKVQGSVEGRSKGTRTRLPPEVKTDPKLRLMLHPVEA